MITMKEWFVNISGQDGFIGYVGENKVSKLEITTDAPEGWNYKLDLKYPSGRRNFLLLDYSDGILSCEILREHLENGTVKAQVRAVRGEQEKHSNWFELEVENSILAAKAFSKVSPTAFEQLESRLDALHLCIESDRDQARQSKESAARSAESAAAEASKVAEQLQESAGLCQQSALEADRAERAAEQAEDRAALAGTNAGAAADAAERASQEAKRAQNLTTRMPIIREGTWWIYNPATERYMDTGQQAQGIQGELGEPFRILGCYETAEELESSVRTPENGDIYEVGTGAPYDIYVYFSDRGWVNNGYFRGPKGDKGDKGDRGPQGDPGDISGKQDKLTGTAGQIVGFDAAGNAVAQQAPETGVTSFHGRKGAVTPEAGDYTAEQVGAAPTVHTHDDRYYTETEMDEKLSQKADTSHAHTAEQVGAAAASHTHDDRYYTETEMDAKLSRKADVNHTHSTDPGVAPAEHTHDDRYYKKEESDAALAGKAATSHTHDGRYYTESEMNTKLAAKADASHTHTASQVGAAATSHTHDDRYYTETEMNTKLAAKSDTSHTHTAAQVGAAASNHTHTASQVGAAATSHTHDERYYTETEINTKLSAKSDTTHTHTAAQVGAAATSHTHDDRYYTESEMNSKLSAKANSSHTHSYAGSSSAGGAASSAVKLSTARTIDGVSFDGSASIMHFAICDTAAATAAKTVTLPGFTLANGARIMVQFNYTNTASSPTLSINGGSAINIYYREGTGNYWASGSILKGIVELVYSSTTGTWFVTNANRAKNAETATALANYRTFLINLASASAASFNGSANVTPGVTGTLGTGNGGTGGTNAPSAIANLINNLSAETTLATDDYFPFRDTSAATGKKITASYLRNYLVPSWAQAASKPTYTASEVGALPITGGTLTGDLRIKGSGNYGTKINLGDSDYVHFYEPTDDCLEIKAKKINFVVSATSDDRFTLNGAAIGGGDSQFVCGTYAGNAAEASTTAQAINLGFQPSFVFAGLQTLADEAQHPWGFNINSSGSSKRNYAYAAYCTSSCPAYGYGVTNPVLKITSTGFEVRNAKYEESSAYWIMCLNSSYYRYVYIAFK